MCRDEIYFYDKFCHDTVYGTISPKILQLPQNLFRLLIPRIFLQNLLQ